MSFFGKKKKDTKKLTGGSEEFIFTLSNIDVAKIDTNFDIEKIGDVMYDKSICGISEGTSLEKLGISSLHKSPLTTILSKDKKKLHTYITLIDIVSKKKLPETTNIPCHGCHRKFSSQPLGIPIEFYPSYYKSKNDPTKVKKLTPNEIKKFPSDSVTYLDYFDTEGIVCSFNCMINVIEDTPSPIYKKTPHLLYMMYKLIFGVYPDQKIVRSPSWKMREEYGGPLSDEEFEKSLQTISFSDTHQCQKSQRETPTESGDFEKESRAFQKSQICQREISNMMNPVGKIFEVNDIDLDKQISIN